MTAGSVLAMQHGGPDAGPAVRIDFSTNAHPLGPTPWVERAVRQAARHTYPDPAYHLLRESLADFHGVDPGRIVPGASASELIWRLTLGFSRQAGPRAQVRVDAPTFGEYARAARALGLASLPAPMETPAPCLHWLCSPNNPTGENLDAAIEAALAESKRLAAPRLLAVDLAYRPFAALTAGSPGHPGVLDSPWAERVVQLWSPNKVHGLTGVRGAYLVWPQARHAPFGTEVLGDLAPSWVLGAEGVAMLDAHPHPEAWQSLRERQPLLRSWKAAQAAMLSAAGWQLRPSELHFGLARPPSTLAGAQAPLWHAHLRAHGIKLRQADSFGLAGWVRLCVRAPAEVAELLACSAALNPPPSI
jgi:histidinol-phosphate aminotransferase